MHHYWLGTKLLAVETRMSGALLWRMLQGHVPSRRERLQLTRSASDMFRLVPFIIIVVVPLGELALPILLRFFPNMLPSTFEEQSSKVFWLGGCFLPWLVLSVMLLSGANVEKGREGPPVAQDAP